MEDHKASIGNLRGSQAALKLDKSPSVTNKPV